MEPRPGYWDVEQCAWRDCEPLHVVPPRLAAPVAAPVPASVLGDVPAPRQGQEPLPARVDPRTSSAPAGS